MKISFTISFLFLISIYSVGCDSSNSLTNSSDCLLLNESIGCDGNCSKSPLIYDACGLCGGDGLSCENESNCPINQSLGCDSICAENPLQNDTCGICEGDGSSCEGLFNVYYNVDVVPIAGFQFNVDGASVLSASGGEAEAAGFMISSSATTIIGFSLSGSVIPLGTGTLISLEIEGNTNNACIDNLIISDSDGVALEDAEIINCNTIKYSE